MARTTSGRKYQVTINNPLEKNFSHSVIKTILGALASTVYWCMCDEIGENGTFHTHVFIIFKNAVMFDTLQKRFYGAHIEKAQGTNQENRDYLRKEGKWQNSDKQCTSLPDSFEESGELPPDRTVKAQEMAAIYDMIKAGTSNFEIMEAFPNALTKLDKLERARQTVLEERWKNEFRTLEVVYLWGRTGVGKTRSVMEQYGYSNVCRVTNYQHPFDSYHGQDVIIFEEFRSSLQIKDMLIYLEGYPCPLPCRYQDKQACFTKVYIITNIPLERQYPQVQLDSPSTWQAFLRRIHKVVHLGGEDDADREGAPW